ncbi:hypothetical protein [Propionimicrobium sp. PCR01-08-3]|uniref:hypothetical protein n=1 Tax=Propionimicrobium sp. PCR01-08-3 TaxID=3052086 RepID=UPI00255CEC0F|nr:hypothetical protein [Propionimicrobium sp. PCR01-08-3]WIY81981.1 hypothetical protein QQ658_10720 [Propionimicrobium sp. PCR01-08-3]
MGIFGWLKGDQKPADPETLASPAPTAEDIEKALAKAERMVLDGHAPTPVLARVLRIITVVRAILPRLSNLGLDSQDAYTVVATATDYLPESVAGYLGLPRDWADTRPVANGKSSLLLLVDQLDLLSLTISRMYDATNRQDAAALVAQGAFLDSKFGGQMKPARMDQPAQASKNLLDL